MIGRSEGADGRRIVAMTGARWLFLALAVPLMAACSAKDGFESWLDRIRSGHSLHSLALTYRGEQVSAALRGDARFDASSSMVSMLGPGGELTIKRVTEQGIHQYQFARAGDRIAVAYRIDGSLASLDEDAMSWLRSAMPYMVRNSTFDLDRRVQSILSERGVTGLLSEISKIDVSHTRAGMIDIAVDHGALSATTFQRFSDELASIDGERDLASIIKHAVADEGLDETRQAILIGSARRISDDFELSQLLIAIAPSLHWRQRTKAAVADAYGTIGEDYDKRTFVESLIHRVGPFPGKREYVLSLADQIHSDFDRRMVEAYAPVSSPPP